MEKQVAMGTVKNAVILVAGEGKRLRPFTEKHPKCFAEIANKRILDNTLEALASQGCRTVWIVIGHFARQIQETVGSSFQGMEINYIVNPVYQTTNSMFSLSMGLEQVKEATWVIEGDVFFSAPVLSLASEADIAWYVDSSVRNLDGAFLEAGEDGRAKSLQIIRDLRLLQDNQYKSIGMLKLSDVGVELVRSWLQQGVEEQRVNDYYDLILGDRMSDTAIKLVDIAGNDWYEVDTMDDLERARQLFA